MVSAAAHLAAISLLLAAPGVQPQQHEPPATEPAVTRSAPVTHIQALILVRSSIMAIHHANLTGNYTVLRDLAAPAFRQSNDAARLTEMFAAQRNSRFYLAGVLVVDPVFTTPPQFREDGAMRMAGYFPSGPVRLTFDLLFMRADTDWRLSGIELAIDRQ